jgi:predicted transcriptional regulator
MCTIDDDQHAPFWSAREEFSSEKRVLHLATVSKKGAVHDRPFDTFRHFLTDSTRFTECRMLLPDKGMEVHLTKKQARRAHTATKAGTVPERLLTSIARYRDAEARFLAAVEKGMTAARRGECVDEEEMDASLEAMLNA